MVITKGEVAAQLAERVFGKPLVSNMYRGLVAEVLVNSVLAPDWEWCAADWHGWDFVHNDGTKLEVKQSAALQTWSEEGRVTSCAFGIAAAKGYFTGDSWYKEQGRPASIYVFAHHPGVEPGTVDHRDAQQWQFYVLPVHVLPPSARSIGLKPVAAISSKLWKSIDENRPSPCKIEYLADAVGNLRRTQRLVP